MNVVLLVVGVAVIAVVMWDVLITALAVGRPSGPLTGRITHAVWSVGLRIGGHRFLAILGVGLMLLVLITWLLGLWAGWSLVFNAGPTGIVDTATGQPVAFWQRVYFTGYTLFTLGNGEYRPEGLLWQLATVAALVNGLALVTLGITYLVSVTSAASERRSLAAMIAALGERADTLVTLAWNGDRFHGLENQLSLLAPRLSLLGQHHLAYPVLHYFHSSARHTSAAPMIARLDEVLTLLRVGVSPEASLPTLVTMPVRNTLTEFLDTLRSAFIDPAAEAPPAPRLDQLRAAGVPTVDDDIFHRRVAEIEDRRRLLLAFIRSDGWTWDDVWPPMADDDEAAREHPKADD